jgi:hypothetical protein
MVIYLSLFVFIKYVNNSAKSAYKLLTPVLTMSTGPLTQDLTIRTGPLTQDLTMSTNLQTRLRYNIICMLVHKHIIVSFLQNIWRIFFLI